LENQHAEYFQELHRLLDKLEAEEDDYSFEQECQSLEEIVAGTINVLTHLNEFQVDVRITKLHNISQRCQHIKISSVQDLGGVRELESEFYGIVESDGTVKRAYQIARQIELICIIVSRLDWIRSQRKERQLSQDEVAEQRYFEVELEEQEKHLRQGLGWTGSITPV
jgi:hypothetical protein